MNRLGELTARQRSQIAWTLLILGTIVLAVGVWLVHYAAFPETELVDGVEVPVVVDYFNWVPRGWLPKSIGYLIAFGGSQLMLAGAAIGFVLGRPMTWARAAFAAFITWIELVLIFGVVPSEWLNLAQTDLNWSPQRVAFTLPRWLTLGNRVDVSLAAIKDAISGTYNVVMLVAAAVFAYKVQEIGKPRPKVEKPTPKSPYGRPLVEGER